MIIAGLIPFTGNVARFFSLLTIPKPPIEAWCGGFEPQKNKVLPRARIIVAFQERIDGAFRISQLRKECQLLVRIEAWAPA